MRFFSFSNEQVMKLPVAIRAEVLRAFESGVRQQMHLALIDLVIETLN